MSVHSVHVVVARTGVANLASVTAALQRAGLEVLCTDDPQVFEDATLAVLPGVGSFGVGMRGLRSTGLDSAITRRAARSRPLLAICLGLQMLCERSEEAPGVAGLGVIPACIEALTTASHVRVPQLGWNTVHAGPCRLVRDGFAYFANSYAAATLPMGWHGAWFEHGERRLAAIESGNILACQFHPELSGAWGQALIERWIRASLESGEQAC